MKNLNFNLLDVTAIRGDWVFYTYPSIDGIAKVKLSGNKKFIDKFTQDQITVEIFTKLTRR